MNKWIEIKKGNKLPKLGKWVEVKHEEEKRIDEVRLVEYSGYIDFRDKFNFRIVPTHWRKI